MVWKAPTAVTEMAKAEAAKVAKPRRVRFRPIVARGCELLLLLMLLLAMDCAWKELIISFAFGWKIRLGHSDYE